MSLTDEKFIAASTYRKSGEAVTTTTWVVALDGARFGFWTSSSAGKTKRLRNSPRITVQPSDARGRVKAGAESVEGTAALFTSGPEFDEVQTKVRAKYGVQVPITRVLNSLGHLGKKFPYGNVVVVITPATPATPNP
jgi:PPOX class probable F420-dependent enzyme